MNKKGLELVLLILSSTSVVLILLQYGLPLTQAQSQFIYIFDLIIVGILAADFYDRARKDERISKFILRNCFEIPAMIPLILLIPFGGPGIIGAVFRSMRMLKVLGLFHKTLKVLEGRRFLYIMVFASMAKTIGAIREYMVEESAQ